VEHKSLTWHLFESIARPCKHHGAYPQSNDGTQFHVVFDGDFSVINGICLHCNMTDPGQWKDLCHASNDSFIEEWHKIKNLWPTFDPKELFDNLYDSETAIADSGSESRKVTFATPIATYKAPEGAETVPSEGVSQPTPSQTPETLEPIHTCQLQ
jgi:hypothetical protein